MARTYAVTRAAGTPTVRAICLGVHPWARSVRTRLTNSSSVLICLILLQPYRLATRCCRLLPMPRAWARPTLTVYFFYLRDTASYPRGTRRHDVPLA